MKEPVSKALEDLIETYCAAWNEPDPSRREEILRAVWAEDATYTDPTAHLVGRGELIDHIGKGLVRYPGSRVVRTSALDTHHGLIRFAWKKILRDGTSLPEGIDLAEISSDGRLRRIVGFFGPLRPLGLDDTNAFFGVEDRLVIQEMIAMYSDTYDRKDAEAFAQLFVEDAVFEVIVPGESSPIVRLSSRAAIREWAAARHDLQTGIQARHYQSGVLFDELTPEVAKVRTMLLLVRQSAADAAPLVHLTGAYHDRWRKTGEGWRLVHRVARLDRDPGFAKHWA